MRNAKRLQKTISDTLSLPKIDNNMFTLNNERFSLTETLLQAAEDTKNQIIRENKNVTVIYDVINPKKANKEEQEKGFVMDWGKERIVQVISNMIDNVAKYVKEGNVTIGMDTNNITNNNKCNNGGDSKEIIANIKDSGKGIDPELLPRLFSKYTLKDAYGCTGL